MSRKDEENRVKLDWRDYIAFTIALLQTVLLPLILLIIALLIVLLLFLLIL